MAATMSPWAKSGAWALDSEEQEQELLQQKEKDDAISSAGQPLADFPSLSAAAATKPKKKKGQTLSLGEFTTYGGPKPAAPAQNQVLTREELMILPTGPRQRTAEELERDRGRLGGGFKSYGYDRNNRGSGGDDSSNSRWGSSRVSDESRRNGSFGRDGNREFAPSRADETDNWAATKISPVGNGFGRRERGGFPDSHSKADESESWVTNKTFLPSEGRRFGSNGGGFERERKVGFGSSGGADSDNWSKKKVELNGGTENYGGGFERERKIGFGSSGGSDSDNWSRKKVESDGVNENGSASGRPRLNLQPRTLPVSNENNDSPGAVVKPKGSNPFGEARPREEVLAEKGQDWKKIEEQLDSVKIKERQEKGNGFGKRGFGSGNAWSGVPEDRIEKSWRKPEVVEDQPQSNENVENGNGDEKAENEHDVS